MTDQPRPPEPGGDTNPAGLGRGRKTPARRVTLGTGKTMVLAEYGQRFRSRIADSILIGIGFVIASIGWLFIVVSQAFAGWGSAGEQPEGLSTADVFLAYSVFIPLLLYEIVAVVWRGKTLGMRAVGIRVVSIQSGQRPSAFESFRRGALPVCLFPLLLGIDSLNPDSEFAPLALLLAACWWLLVQASVYWGEDQRGWHDLISGTVVVTADPPVPADPNGGDAV
ncbi:RDD family protein [Candidatus Poriferisocius sp.]|uniref:RDD family protein n=1 Tax=Candidatus Poriferisocius sp. TaxID=3101276 RepID=UPI003B01C8F3